MAVAMFLSVLFMRGKGERARWVVKIRHRGLLKEGEVGKGGREIFSMGEESAAALVMG